MHTSYLNSIKSFEGFTAKAKWDYAQHSNGYGTEARYPGEVIDRGEAQSRFEAEISRARRFVERETSGLDEGTKAALTSLTFNAGTRWASSGLGAALREGDLAAAKEQFVKYNKAGGAELPGLVKRRAVEASWFGNASIVEPKAPVVAAVLPDADADLVRTRAKAEFDPATVRPACSSTGSPPFDAAPHSSSADIAALSARHSAAANAIAEALLLLDLGLPPLGNYDRDKNESDKGAGRPRRA